MTPTDENLFTLLTQGDFKRGFPAPVVAAAWSKVLPLMISVDEELAKTVLLEIWLLISPVLKEHLAKRNNAQGAAYCLIEGYFRACGDWRLIYDTMLKASALIGQGQTAQLGAQLIYDEMKDAIDSNMEIIRKCAAKRKKPAEQS